LLMAIDPCPFNCMSHFISQSLHSFTHVATQNFVQLMPFWSQCCIRSSRSGSSRIIHDASKRIGKVLPISYNKQWPAGNCGLPGLSGCHTSSLCWVPLFFPIGTMPSSRPFPLCFPEAPAFDHNKPCAGIRGDSTPIHSMSFFHVYHIHFPIF
jgi:hypothetical protein